MRTIIIGLAALGLAGPAAAREVLLPETKPLVSIQFPDDWTVTMVDTGPEAVSPDKKAFVIMKILTRPIDDPNKWVKQALARFEALGVHFDTQQKSNSVAVNPTTVKEAEAESKKSETKKGEVAPVASVKAATDAAKPVEGKPAETKPVPTVPTFAMNANTITALPTPELVRHALTYKGTSMDGVPVDVELVTFTLSNNQSFFMLQESGSTDDRAISIIKSVKRAP